MFNFTFRLVRFLKNNEILNEITTNVNKVPLNKRYIENKNNTLFGLHKS